jgi:hypothetical protein
MKGQNLFSIDQKTTSPAYRDGWDRIFKADRATMAEYSMAPVFDQLVQQFCQGAAQAREKLATELIAKGYSPDTVTIAEKTWYDEEKFTMRFECWPVLRA